MFLVCRESVWSGVLLRLLEIMVHFFFIENETIVAHKTWITSDYQSRRMKGGKKTQTNNKQKVPVL